MFTQQSNEDGTLTLDTTMLGKVEGITSDNANIFKIKVKALTEDSITINSVEGTDDFNNTNEILTTLVGVDLNNKESYFIPTTSEENYVIDILSNNNNLSSLTIGQGVLKPDF